MIALIIPVNSIQHVQEGFHTLRHAGHGAVAKPKNYFFDFGSNDGSSITFFMGCDVFGCQGAQETLGGRKTSPLQGMGTRFPGRSWDIIAVEANLRHETALRKVKATIEEKTESKVTLFAGHALATHSGNITFYFDTAEGDAGATVMSESGSVWGHKFQHVVSALDIVSLFRSLNVHVQDRVVVKMDIEGAECDVCAVCGWCFYARTCGGYWVACACAYVLVLINVLDGIL